MAKKETFSFQKVFEEHPIKSCIGSFLFGVACTFTIFRFYHETKIQEMKERYEDKIAFLIKEHEQDLIINEIKLSKKEGIKYYLNIESGSELEKDLSKLINRTGDE